ncbi:MAG TPA: cytochrome c oxidase assembly protein [Parvularculaceae bacterium]|nr:cytochrome c oxidase assembly protein [Caulobacterales bacterium]HOP19987.1 cytochrome c oxidase assembly protein [Amphiplicatus sp.]HPE31556.1 cytochrome c oxidase assembly protein [Parvularculaceae bacterium]HRX38650.1 cytochrome c oxidase assembly protein [Parvularculaceae bacterium]
MSERASKNTKTAAIMAGVAVGMVGMSFAAVPLYRAFCQVTGFGGTTQRAENATGEVLERQVTVRFDANTAQDIPWRFKPEQPTQKLHIGETGLAFFSAENLSSKPVSGRAAFNVTPAKAGVYFKKIECFCFTEQTLAPGEKVDMPVTYFIDPKIAKDINLDDVETITLAYTFFPSD